MKKNKKINEERVENNGSKKGRRIRGNRRGGRDKGRENYSKKLSKAITTLQTHKLDGIYILNSDRKYLATKNLTPGETVYEEELINLEESRKEGNNESDSDNNSDIEIIKKKVEYRIWNIYYSKLGALIENGITNIYMRQDSKVIYLGAGNDCYSTISHISDIIGKNGIVYGVEKSEIKGLDLKNIAKKRDNIIPIINDAKKPYDYKNFISSLVDCLIVDISDPAIANIISINAGFFLNNKGGFISIINTNKEKSNILSETEIIDGKIKLLRAYNLYVREFNTLEPFSKGYAAVSGIYKPFREVLDED